MSDEIKRDKSRNSPRLTLSDAIEAAKKLHSKAGKANITSETAAMALDYGGLNGAALTTIGALSQYGLIDRERGKHLSVSQLALKLIHPINEAQELASKRESALMPKVFNELYTGGFHKCDEALIANHLIQNDFTPDGAKKAASVFKANVELAKLTDEGIIIDNKVTKEDKKTIYQAPSVTEPPGKLFGDFVKEYIGSHPPGKGAVLGCYSVPLGSNEATITITGTALSTEDFDALGDFVDYCKKQFQRRAKTETQAPRTESTLPEAK